MIKTKEELMTQIQGILGDNSSDEALDLLDNFGDTFDSLVQGDGTDWKAKYEENDASWRKRYKERFNSGSNKDDFDPQDERKRTDFCSLFK